MSPQQHLVREQEIARGPVLDMDERCGDCEHHRYEHHEGFGCMNWDERRARGWCQCEGFRPHSWREIVIY